MIKQALVLGITTFLAFLGGAVVCQIFVAFYYTISGRFSSETHPNQKSEADLLREENANLKEEIDLLRRASGYRAP